MTLKRQTVLFLGGLFLLLYLAFGLLIPWLGFFWDDWPVLLTWKLRGAAGFWEFYTYDRPLSAWTYVVMMPLLGNNAPAWQLTSLVLRGLTAALLGWALVGLWPRQRREVGLVVLLFAVYPVFTQQFISVAYSQHWICYALYMLSLGCMVWAYRRPRRAVLLTVVGVLATLGGLLTMEYFAGLELLRPVALWILAGERGPHMAWSDRPERRRRARVVLFGWLPYLAALAAFGIWRLFFVHLPEGANAPSLLYDLTAAPLDTLARLLEMILHDLAYVIVTVWADVVKPETIQLRDRFLLLSWVLAVLVAGAMALALRRAGPPPTDGTEDVAGPRWIRQALTLGAVALALGPLPVWLTERQIIIGFYSDRFGIPAMLGAALLVVGLVCWLTPGWSKRLIVVSLLVGLSVGMHVRTANDYRWSWVKQTRFYWQLKWRAPTIQPHTAIFSDGEIFPYVGLYSTVAGVNLLYPPADLPEDELAYYFYSLGREFGDRVTTLPGGIDLGAREFRMYTFRGRSDESLVIWYEPGVNTCLHVLSPTDDAAPGLPLITRQALPAARLDRILDRETPGYPPEAIFGKEPEHGWCYLYQKADLARQLGDWPRAAALADQAAALGFSPDQLGSNAPFEWLPFIEGYARAGRLEEARSLTRAIFAGDVRIRASACRLWQGIPPSAEVEGALSDLECVPPR